MALLLSKTDQLDMTPLPLLTTTSAPPPLPRNSRLTMRSASFKDPLPLYAILGKVGAVVALLILALALLLGGWCCYRQARKTHESGVGNRQHTTYHTSKHKHWHIKSHRPSSTLSRNRSHESATALPAILYTPFVPFYFTNPDTSASSLDQTLRRRRYPCPIHGNDLQCPFNYNSQWRPPEDHDTHFMPLPRPVSAFEYGAGHSARSDMYTRPLRFEPYESSRLHSLPARSASRSTQQGEYVYNHPAASKPRYKHRSRPLSSKWSERGADDPEEWLSLSSDGRPSLRT